MAITALPVFSNSKGVFAVVDQREVPLVAFKDEHERFAVFVRMHENAVDLFAAATVLLWRLADYPEMCEQLDKDDSVVAATLRLVEKINVIKGRDFSPEEFQ